MWKGLVHCGLDHSCACSLGLCKTGGWAKKEVLFLCGKKKKKKKGATKSALGSFKWLSSGCPLMYVSCFHTGVVTSLLGTGCRKNITKQSLHSRQDGFGKRVNILKAIQSQVWIFISILWTFVLLFCCLESRACITIGSFLWNFTPSIPWQRWEPVAMEMISKIPVRVVISIREWASKVSEFSTMPSSVEADL